MPLGYFLPTYTTESIEYAAENLAQTTQSLERVTENLADTSESLRNVAQAMDPTQITKMANLLVGSFLSTRSVVHAIYARTMTSKIFFFLSCVSGSVATIDSTFSLYDQCSSPINALVANSMAFSFYMAGRNLEHLHDQFNKLKYPIPAPSPNFQKILTPRGGSQSFDHQIYQSNFSSTSKVYYIKLPNESLLKITKIVNLNE